MHDNTDTKYQLQAYNNKFFSLEMKIYQQIKIK